MNDSASSPAIAADATAIVSIDGPTDGLADAPADARLHSNDPLRTAQGRMAIFGGTFDPIHIGHLILAEEAWFQLKLDQVYLVPAGDPPHKQNRRLTPAVHRLRMCELAIADIDYLTVSRIDVDRPGPHYTSDMVRLMRKQVGSNTEIYFLMGMDSLRDLPSWHEAAWLVENCKLVALSRHEVELDWTRLEKALPGVRDKMTILDMPELEIASHILQARVRQGQTIRHQVPRAVEEYIYAHHLYVDAPIDATIAES